jgi:rhodanese-related sulfurtransferase
MPLHTLPGSPEETPEVDLAEAVRVWTERSGQLVDVREQSEWDDGHIPDSIHIPLGQISERAHELTRELPVVVLCAAGVRSLTGADELLARGFQDVASLNGGILAWAAAGYPVEQ